VNADSADQADETESGFLKIDPLLRVLFRVVSVFRGFQLSKKLTTKHTKHTKKNTNKKDLPRSAETKSTEYMEKRRRDLKLEISDLLSHNSFRKS
jgi:hypothetical protein